MQIIFGFDSLPAMKHPVATVGSYDGLHCGHAILLDEVKRIARENGGESVVLTFEPHPRITLHNDDGLRLLTTFEEKCLLLERCGVDYVVVIPFDTAFSRLSREEFINDYIVGKLHIEHLVVGYNHHFGHNKEGDYSFLADREEISVIEVKQQLVDSGKVSSTIIRQSIERGEIQKAVRQLGHPYIIIGIAGDDAAITTTQYKLLPPDGTYAAQVNGRRQRITINNGRVYTGNVGKTIVEIYDNERC